jgi:hypothetical protein
MWKLPDKSYCQETAECLLYVDSSEGYLAAPYNAHDPIRSSVTKSCHKRPTYSRKLYKPPAPQPHFFKVFTNNKGQESFIGNDLFGSCSLRRTGAAFQNALGK